ncbi:PLP-dependent aminotransferase family protein [Rhodobacteraceae bacterium KMM 6894]|nr:PLP-dependent aminotransferase family protein [Rhodobacteraceae bacterium KMM 6894]
MWVPEISDSEGPRYLALASAISEAIENGDLPPGGQLPPQRDLARKLNVTVGTVGRAYNVAKERQLLSSQVGRGTFVLEAAMDEGTVNYLPERQPGTIDFACYSLAVPGLVDILSNALIGVAHRSSLLPLQKYGPAPGFLPHRSAGATWIGRTGLKVAPESVLVCNGAQQALMLALTALTKANETVLVEELAYSGIKALGSLLERKLSGVAIDEQGLIPAALEAKIIESGARLIYMQPTCHNPTGAVMQEDRRREIADIVKRHAMLVIEDDAAVGGLRDRPLPLAHFAPDNVLYLTSLSKTISPALRVAYMACPQQIFEHVSNTLHALTLANPPIMAELATTLINEGTASAIAERNLEALAERHKMMSAHLGDIPHGSHPAAFFIWLKLPMHWNSKEFYEAARRAGVSVVPADNFTIGQNAPNAVRISVNAGQKIEIVEKGLDTLIQLMEERRAPLMTV